MNINLKVIIGSIIVVLLLLIWLISSVAIPTGTKGVITLFGKVNEEEILNSGYHILNPLSRVKIVNIQRQKESFETMTYTKDVQTATLKIVFTYSLNSNSVALLVKNFGYDWKDKLVEPVLQDVIKNVIGKWDAASLVENRTKAIQQIQQSLQKELNKKYITYESFDLINIDYSDAFEKAIEEKQIATQDAIKEKNNTVKVNEQAKQKLISAEAEAKAMRIKTQALSHNKALVDYEAVQKWDGHLPSTMSGNVIPFLNLKAK